MVLVCCCAANQNSNIACIFSKILKDSARSKCYMKVKSPKSNFFLKSILVESNGIAQKVFVSQGFSKSFHQSAKLPQSNQNFKSCFFLLHIFIYLVKIVMQFLEICLDRCIVLQQLSDRIKQSKLLLNNQKVSKLHQSFIIISWR